MDKSKPKSDLQEENAFFKKQISILELQSQVKELEAKNKIMKRALGIIKNTEGKSPSFVSAFMRETAEQALHKVLD